MPCSAHAPHSRTLSNLYRWLFLFISGTARMKQRARPATQSSQSFHPHGTANRESAGRLLCQTLPTIQRFHGPTSPRDWSPVARSEAGSTQSSHVATGRLDILFANSQFRNMLEWEDPDCMIRLTY